MTGLQRVGLLLAFTHGRHDRLLLQPLERRIVERWGLVSEAP